MIACPNCSHENMAGSAFCVECGVALLAADALTTLKMEGEQSAGAAGHRPSPPVNSVPGADTWVTLHLLDSGLVRPVLGERRSCQVCVWSGASSSPVRPTHTWYPFGFVNARLRPLPFLEGSRREAISLSEREYFLAWFQPPGVSMTAAIIGVSCTAVSTSIVE